MTTIATFWKTEEAHLFRLQLEAAGIKAVLQDENITQILPWRTAAIGGVRVQVEDCYAAAALKLKEGWEPPVGDTLPDADDAFECCSCRAKIPAEETRCASCGWSYEDNGDGGATDENEHAAP